MALFLFAITPGYASNKDLETVRRIRLVVLQTYEAAPQHTETLVEETTTAMLAGAGFEVVTSSEPGYDGILSVVLHGKALKATYSPEKGGFERELYEGAQVEGKLSLEVGGKNIFSGDFTGRIDTPSRVSEGGSHSDVPRIKPADAPFREAWLQGDFIHRFREMLEKNWGPRRTCAALLRWYSDSERERFKAGGSACLSAIQDALTDPNEITRMRAIQILTDTKAHQSISPLLKILTDAEATPALRALAAQTLGELGDPAAIGPLKAIAGEIENNYRLSSLRKEVLKSLKKLEEMDPEAAKRKRSSCEQQCIEMSKNGELKPGVTLEQCVQSICQ